MSKPLKKNELGYLGEEFQYKLVHEFTENPSFFEDLNTIVNQNMFTDPMLKIYVGVMKDYLGKYGTVPGYGTIRTILIERAHNEIEKDSFSAVVDKVIETSTEGVDYVRDLATSFFKQQNIVAMANKILKIAGDGDATKYDSCFELVTNAILQGSHNDTGTSVFTDLDSVLSDDYRIAIPTGISKVDEKLEGGIGKGELGVIIAGSGFGKAQPLDARILTPNGYKTMGEMKVGDYVIGRDGKPHMVSGVFPQGTRPIYKVSFSNGTSCECDIEHLWSVNSWYQRCGEKYVKGQPKENRKRAYIKDMSFKTLTLREILEKGLLQKGKHTFRYMIPKTEKVEFTEQALPIDPYLFGYYLGDGSFSRCAIAVGCQDVDQIQSELQNIIHQDLHVHYREARNIYDLTIVGNTKKLLLENTDKNAKSDTKFIPEKYLFNTIENRVALLQGLMDSDGCANKNGSSEFASKSKRLAENVVFLVRSLGGFASISENKSGYKKADGQYVDCGKRYRVTISLCDNTIPLFRLQRKQQRVHYRTEPQQHIFIVNAEYVGEKQAQCIMVDSDEHLYLTEDFIVTHNTSMTTGMANYAATYKCEANNFKGFKVLQIVFEDRVKQIQRKHLGRITGIEARNLGKPEFQEIVRQKLEEYPDKEMLQENLKIIRFPSGDKSAWDIEIQIKKLINTGFKPDLCILDYFECLRHKNEVNVSNEFEKEGITMRKFEAMAGEMDMAMWIPVQGTKDSIGKEIVSMDNAGGSFKKVQIAHIVISIARSLEDQSENKATISILKNRSGCSGAVFQGADFNNGTCTVSTDNVDEFASRCDFNESRQETLQDIQKKILEGMKRK